MSSNPGHRPHGVKTIANRTNLFTILMVIALFAILPLSQSWLTRIDDDTVVVRRVDVAPPPPPPSETRRENPSAQEAAQGGLGLKSLISTVNLQSLSSGDIQIQAGTLNMGLGELDLGGRSNATFSMEGIGFGIAGVDRPPFVVRRPTLNSDFMKKKGIEKFQTVVMVKWLKDGSLTFISIEEIQYPDIELAAMVRNAVAGLVYTKPTIDGEPVERFLRLPLTINRTD